MFGFRRLNNFIFARDAITIAHTWDIQSPTMIANECPVQSSFLDSHTIYDVESVSMELFVRLYFCDCDFNEYEAYVLRMIHKNKQRYIENIAHCTV